MDLKDNLLIKRAIEMNVLNTQRLINGGKSLHGFAFDSWQIEFIACSGCIRNLVFHYIVEFNVVWVWCCCHRNPLPRLNSNRF